MSNIERLMVVQQVTVARLQELDYQQENHSVEAAVIRQMRNKLERIEHALKLVEIGQYGLCQQCHGSIDIKRLEVAPEAEFCLECQLKMERRLRRAYRTTFTYSN